MTTHSLSSPKTECQIPKPLMEEEVLVRKWWKGDKQQILLWLVYMPAPFSPLLSPFDTLVLQPYSPFMFPCSKSVSQTVSKAGSRCVPVWLKHYLRGFATLFLKRSDILSQLPPLPTGKLKMPQSPQATRFIYLHTYWVRENAKGGEDLGLTVK